MLLLPGLDHFAPDLLAGLPDPGLLELRGFPVRSPADLQAALAWTDDPARDSVWFEFCWPPFPDWIARTEFGGRRVVVRVHRIEAYGTDHAARAPWWKVDDAVVVGPDMARRLHAAVPTLAPRTRLHVVPNGVDLARFGAASPAPRDPFVLLLEEVNEPVYRVDRMLTQLLRSGWLEQLAGVVIGDLGTTDDAVVRDRLGPLGVPVLVGAAVGHGDRNLALPLGADVRLEVGADEAVLTLA